MITLSTIFSRRGGKGLAGVAGLALMVGAMFVTSCDKDDNDSDTPATRITITLSAAMEQPSGDTKTQLNSTTVIWSASDQIKVYDNADNPKFSTLTAGSAGETSTNFTGEEPDGYLTPSYAIYPASAATGCNSTGTITFTLPATQSYVANSFGNGCNIAVGKVENDAIAFKNVCGYLKLQLKLEEGYAFTVGKIVLKGNSNEKLNGTFSVDASNTTNPTATTSGTPTAAEKTITLDCGDGVALSATEATNFYFVVPVGAFATSGFTAAIYSTSGALKSSLTVTNKQNTINRSMVRVMPEKEIQMLTVPNEYTELEYLRCDAYAYINTGYTVDYTDLKLEYKYLKTDNLEANPLGVDRQSSGNQEVSGEREMHGHIFSSSGYYGNSQVMNIGTQLLNTVYTVTFEISEAAGYGTWNINGNTYSGSNKGMNSWSIARCPDFLFATNSGGKDSDDKWTPNYKMTGRLYYAIYYKNGATIPERYFVPVRRISDSVLGMYELMTNTFFTNDGSGSFYAPGE